MGRRTSELQYGKGQARLILKEIEDGAKVEHKTAFGRITIGVSAEVSI